MWNSRDHVSSSQHLEVMYTFIKLKNSLLFENLNDAYIISMPMFATCVHEKLKISILKENVLQWQLAKFGRISHRSEKTSVFIVEQCL